MEENPLANLPPPSPTLWFVTPAELSRAVLSTVRRAVAAEELRVVVPEKVVVQRPPRPGCGDYATNVALQIARAAGQPPHAVAEILARRLQKEPGIAQVEIAGPGFLNITLSARAYGDVVRQVREQRSRYGYGEGLAEVAVTVAAPDPLALRGPVVADVVNRLFAVAGARPAGPGEAPEILHVQEPVSAPGAEFVDGRGPGPGGPPPELVHVREPVAGSHTESLGGQVSSAGSWTESLGGQVSSAATRAESLGGQAPAPASQDPGGNVLAPPPGPPHPPPAPPPPHHPLGPDATRWALLRPPVEDVPRLTPDLLDQRESNPLFRIRYARARAHALVGNARDLGVRIEEPEGPDAPTADAPPYHPHPAETELLGLIADYPRVIETAARRRGPDRLARHLERLADAFFRFHDECPPLPKGDEKPSAAHAARIRLADATGVVLAGGLRLLGISAPDHM